MKNLLVPKNGNLLVALLVFFVVFGLVFDPLSTFWLALAFAGLFAAHRLMQPKKIGGARKVVRRVAKKTRQTTRKTKKGRRG